MFARFMLCRHRRGCPGTKVACLPGTVQGLEEEPLSDHGIPAAAADPWLERCLTCLAHITSQHGGQGEPWAAPGRERWFPRGPP